MRNRLPAKVRRHLDSIIREALKTRIWEVPSLRNVVKRVLEAKGWGLRDDDTIFIPDTGKEIARLKEYSYVDGKVNMVIVPFQPLKYITVEVDIKP